ncbi:MAG: GNAT family N-acetyltransferase [Oscillospiraceae bacterium]|nr:GNAT family N-acetyltransferase [Oscillospiraceae bacterium]
MVIKRYDSLCDDARAIREAVFVREQGFVNEFDDIDGNAVHFVLYVNGQAAGTCRIYRGDDNEFHLGRLAVMSEYRGMSLGKMLISEAEGYASVIGAEFITLSAQVRVKDFYKKCGYSAVGEEYLDEDCPHIKMVKKLSQPI